MFSRQSVLNYASRIKDQVESIEVGPKGLYSKTVNSLVLLEDECKDIIRQCQRLRGVCTVNKANQRKRLFEELKSIYENPPCASIEANNVIKYLYRWYLTRIISLDPGSSEFRYKTEDIPNCFKAIVISYSIHLQDGLLYQFDSGFRTWESAIACDERPYSNFALPYEAYVYYKRLNEPHIVSCAGAAIWNQVWAAGSVGKLLDKLAAVKNSTCLLMPDSDMLSSRSAAEAQLEQYESDSFGWQNSYGDLTPITEDS